MPFSFVPKSIEKMKFVLGLFVLCLVLSQVEDEDGILNLDEKTFHAAIKDNENVFLFFHSSVCC